MRTPHFSENLLPRSVALALSAGLTWSVLSAVVQGFQAPPASTVRWVELPRVVVVARREAPQQRSTLAGEVHRMPQGPAEQGKLTHLSDISSRPAL